MDQIVAQGARLCSDGAMKRTFTRCGLLAGALLLAACGAELKPGPPPLRPEQARALIQTLLPEQAPDRPGWSGDIYAAFATLNLEVTPQHVCAVVAVAEQESGFVVNPVIPGLPEIARKEIDRRAEHAGVPVLVVHAALHLSSPDGRSYEQRIEAARTERDLSDIYEDLVSSVPLGKLFLEDRNPIRTAGPMQVSVTWSERYAKNHDYPYPVDHGLRREVFSRRGSLYFGTAHLLDYSPDYDRLLYRFADYNAGRYASRNAAFQHALAVASGVPLAADGALLPGDGSGPPDHTELAARALGRRLDLDEGDIHHDLEHGNEADFSDTALYRGVYALAENGGQPLPRARVPQIDLKSPKITRHLTTAWYADRVDGRYRRCMEQAGQGAN
jgi:hypothetical protein